MAERRDETQRAEGVQEFLGGGPSSPARGLGALLKLFSGPTGRQAILRQFLVKKAGLVILFHVFETEARLITKCILAKILVRRLLRLPGLFLRP